jgi:hypothetical protein
MAKVDYYALVRGGGEPRLSLLEASTEEGAAAELAGMGGDTVSIYEIEEGSDEGLILLAVLDSTQKSWRVPSNGEVLLMHRLMVRSHKA